MKAWKIAGVVTLLVMPLNINASISSKLDDWFGAQNYQNVTPSGSYEGQSARYYSLGGYSMRNPVVPIRFVNVQTPRVSAGCGGIDIYAGGFSAIDSDQLLNNIRAIGQNATSLAFMLAISTVSPMLSDIMQKIQGWANEFNKMGKDSCEWAKKAVGGAMSMFTEQDTACIIKAVEQQGMGYTEAENHCTTGGGKTDTLNGPGGPNQVSFVQGNLAWHVMMQNAYFQNDTQIAELVMNLAGTLIIRRTGAASDSPLLPQKIPAAVVKGVLTPRGEAIFKALMDGGEQQLDLYRCTGNVSNNPDTGCATVSATPERVNFETQGMRQRVIASFREIVNAVRNDTELRDEEVGLVSSTRIPIYRFITSTTAIFGDALQVQSMADDYATLIAAEIVNEQMLRMLEIMHFHIENLDAGKSDSTQFKEYNKQLQLVRAGIADLSKENRSKAASLENMMYRIKEYEGMLLPRLGRGVASSAMWRR